MPTTTFVVSRENAIDDLQSCIRFCSSPTFDPWTNVVELDLCRVPIDRRLMEVMFEFLNSPFARDPTGESDEEIRWIEVTFHSCDLIAYARTRGAMDLVHNWFSAMADRTRRLSFDVNHYDLLVDFLNTPNIEHRAVQRLHIWDEEGLTPEEYARLCNMIARNHQLIELYLDLRFYEEAPALLFSVENAINMEELTFHESNLPDNAQSQLITRGIDPLIQLLQNPQNRLRKLELIQLGLQDRQLMAISELLPSCRIEYFDFSWNLIELAGMMEFVRHLPRMQSLKEVRFYSNPWKDSETACNMVGHAVLQSVIKTPFLESVDEWTCFPQGPLICHYLIANIAGRRLLTSVHPVPDGLWSLLLERASDETRYTTVAWGGSTAKISASIARYNAVYFLLQNISMKLSYA